MHPTANHLIQLQELCQIREEQRLHGKDHGKDHLEQLNASIKELAVELPKDIRTQFEKLDKKDHLVIVPVSDGGCAGCGMRLAISQVQAVRMGRELQACPNCARMLYYPESAARRIGKAARRFGPRKVGISRFSSQSLVIPDLVSDSLEGAIGELAERMEEEKFIDKAEPLIEGALRREAIVSTVTRHGLAFPHVRGVEGGGLTLAMGVSRSGIRAGQAGSPLTRIVFLIVIPTAASAFYLKLLAGLTEALVKPDARKALLAEKEQDKLWKALCKVTRTTIK